MNSWSVLKTVDTLCGGGISRVYPNPLVYLCVLGRSTQLPGPAVHGAVPLLLGGVLGRGGDGPGRQPLHLPAAKLRAPGPGDRPGAGGGVSPHPAFAYGAVALGPCLRAPRRQATAEARRGDQEHQLERPRQAHALIIFNIFQANALALASCNRTTRIERGVSEDPSSSRLMSSHPPRSVQTTLVVRCGGEERAVHDVKIEGRGKGPDFVCYGQVTDGHWVASHPLPYEVKTGQI